MIPLAYCKCDYCKKFIIATRFKGISGGSWETVNDSRSAFVSGWKRANCHPRCRGSIDLNIKTMPAERYTRGLRYLDSLLPFFIFKLVAPPKLGFVLRTEGFVPWTSELLSTLLSHSYSRTLLVLSGAQETSASRFIFDVERRGIGKK